MHDRTWKSAAAACLLAASVPAQSLFVPAGSAKDQAESNGFSNYPLMRERGVWQNLIAQSRDEYEQAAYLEVLAEVETERRARMLDRARDEFRKRNGRDIRTPSELWAGPLRILRGAPPAHPEEKGQRWQLDPQSGEIVSSFYKRRYRIHVNPADEAERRAFRAGGATPAPDANEGQS